MKLSRRSGWQLSALVLACAGAAALAAPPPATFPARGPSRTASGPISAANKAAAEEHFQKAKDLLYTQNKPQDAYAENENALQLDPANANALLLRRVLQTKLADTPAETGNNGQTTVAGRLKTLTPAQISVIRVLESRGDEKLRGSVPRKVLEEFWENVAKKDASNPDQISQQAYQSFINMRNFSDSAHRIAESKDMKYIEQLNVTSDPAALVAFRGGTHTYALQNCATSECHGGDKAGSFRMVTGSTQEAVYTNFYIMSMYVAKAGGQMIDRNAPEKSLFLQYSLPKTLAQLTHPGKVDPRKLATTNDPRYQAMSNWVKSLAFPKPTYGIAYELPGAPTNASATAPASVPATTTSHPATRGR